MRKTGLALLVAGVISLGAVTSPAAADQPSPPNCEGQFIASRAQDATGRRNAAELFLGPYPQAVRDIEFLLQAICAP
jgi:hypothetical protein